ncbi:hypothetical protein GCM10028805_31040 [Spirosoma harenae]
MPSTFLPYRYLNYQTDLTPDQIGQRLRDNVITGFTLYSEKPYYGTFTPYSFSVRKTSSRIKKQSMAPSIAGSYNHIDGKTIVTLDVRPSPPVIIAFSVFGIPLMLFVFACISEFFKTEDIAVLVNGLIPLAILYGILWIIFQAQSSSDIRFWEYTLALRQLHT